MPGGGWKSVAGFARSHADGRTLDHAVRKTTLLVKVEAVNPYISSCLGIKAADAPRTIESDALKALGQPKCVVCTGHRIIRCMLAKSGLDRQQREAGTEQ